MIVTVKNKNAGVVLNDHPFYLQNALDLSGLTANINIADSGQDGGLFLNSRYNTREVEILGYIDAYGKTKEQVQSLKKQLYDVCNPKEPLTFEIETNGELFFLNAYAVSFPVFKNDFENSNNRWQSFLMQFTASDPYIYKAKKYITFSNITPMFGFPMRFNSVKFGETRTSLIETINNEGLENCPIEIKIKALQPVVNPYFLNVETQKQIKFTTSMVAGDEIVVNTGRKKEVYRMRNGTKEIFYYAMDLTSDFLQLESGDNIFRFGADSGEENLEIVVTYQERLGGI